MRRLHFHKVPGYVPAQADLAHCWAHKTICSFFEDVTRV